MSHLQCLRIVVELALLNAAGSALAAQGVDTIRINGPVSEIAVALGAVTGIREERTGEVLVVDSRRNTVLWVNFKQGTVEQTGTVGEAAGQYCHPIGAIALPGDSSAVYDAARARFTMFSPAGVPAGQLEPTIRDPKLLRSFLIRSAGAQADRAGNLYVEGTQYAMSADFQTQYFDSVAVERWSRTTWRAETVAYLRSSQAPGTRSAISTPGPIKAFRSEDQWSVAPDGRLAIAHLSPYHIDIVQPAGRRLNGAIVPAAPVLVRQAERDAWLRDEPFAGDGGTPPTTRTAGRILPGRCGALGDAFAYQGNISWPDTLPAFLLNALTFGPRGYLWIRRAVAAGEPEMADVVDSTGKLVSRVIFPPDTRLVGLGTAGIYAVRVDDEHRQFLERLQYPESLAWNHR